MRYSTTRARCTSAMLAALLPLTMTGCNKLEPAGGSPTMALLRDGSEKVCIAGDVQQALRDIIVTKPSEMRYDDTVSTETRITDNGNNSEPVLSPDGRSVAYVHLDGQPTNEGDAGFTSLWIADLATGETRRLLASRPNDEPKLNMASFGSPRFSLDGGFIYVEADAWATSGAVHQVSVSTGAERFVVAGGLLAVIRTGLYRGHLIVRQHRYRKTPGMGSYDPLVVVRPDGTEVLMIPGRDDDGDNEQLLAAWLQRNGWEAW